MTQGIIGVTIGGLMGTLFRDRTAVRRARFAFAGAALLIAIFTAWYLHQRSKAGSPHLNTPMLAIDDLSAKSLYYNAAARPWLIARRAELLAPDDKIDGSERVRNFIQAAQEPKLFRQLDRLHRFDTVLIVGDPSQNRPLLDHLVETKDWTLVYLDHTSYIYKRLAQRAWQPDLLKVALQHFNSRREQATVLAQAALKMLAVRMAPAARASLEEAETLDSLVPDIWNAHAVDRMQRGEWPAALKNVERALALDAGFLPAIASKTQILYSTGKLSEAVALSSQLVAERPDDPGLLFYHARIAHDARAFREEIDALEKLVALADRQSRPASGYRIYLAQAYAADGQAEPSIKQFRAALADPGLSKEQRLFAEETLAQIRSRSGL